MKSFKSFIAESTSGRDLIIVDIQPEYKSAWYRGFVTDFCQYLNENEFNSILYLFNGPDLGMESWDEITEWLLDNGLEEDTLNDIQYYDKGYAFFRSYMDMGMDEEDMLNLIRHMVQHKIYDSRDLPDEVWEQLGLDRNEWEPDMINIPDVLFKLQHYNNPLMCGGGRWECLKEIELCFDALNKPYELVEEFVY